MPRVRLERWDIAPTLEFRAGDAKRARYVAQESKGREREVSAGVALTAMRLQRSTTTRSQLCPLVLHGVPRAADRPDRIAIAAPDYRLAKQADVDVDRSLVQVNACGLVGAGGLGLKLSASLNVLAWPQVTSIFIVILGTVFVSKWISARVRHAII